MVTNSQSPKSPTFLIHNTGTILCLPKINFTTSWTTMNAKYPNKDNSKLNSI